MTASFDRQAPERVCKVPVEIDFNTRSTPANFTTTSNPTEGEHQ